MTTYRLRDKPRKSFTTIGQLIDYLKDSTEGVVEGLIDVELNSDGRSRSRLKYVLQDDLVIIRTSGEQL